MKLFISFFSLFFYSFSVLSQCTQVTKLDKLAQKGNFNKTKEKADDWIKKDKKNAYPFYLVMQEANKQYQQTKKRQYLNFSLFYAKRALTRDKKKECIDKFQIELSSIKKESLSFADSLYNIKSIDQATFYYNLIAQIYSDTTTNYKKILASEKENINKSKTQAEIDFEKIPKEKLQHLNKKDENGNRTGLWIKFYENKLPAYIIYFKAGKPIGEYLRYHENGARKARLFYDKDGYAFAQLFDKNKTLLASGSYTGINKDSIWKYYYSNGKLAAQYSYKMGVKNGRSFIYYPNGKILEELDWKNDQKEGIGLQYYESGKKRMEYRFENNLRNGAFYLYHENGIYDTKGYFKDGLQDKTWTYYDKYNKLIKTEKYVNGKLPIENKISQLEDSLQVNEGLLKIYIAQKKSVEEIQKINIKTKTIKAELKKLEAISPSEKESKELKVLDKKAPASEDPMNYINNPQSYIRNHK